MVKNGVLVIGTIFLVTIGIEVEAVCDPIPQTVPLSVRYDRVVDNVGKYEDFTYAFITCPDTHTRLLEHAMCRQDGKWADADSATVLTDDPSAMLCQEINTVSTSTTARLNVPVEPEQQTPILGKEEKVAPCLMTDNQVTCPDPGQGVNAHRLRRERNVCGTEHLVNETVTYRCESEYVFNSNRNVHVSTCLENGHWDFETHICYEKPDPVVKCSDPGLVSHSNRSPQQDPSCTCGFNPGVEVIFQCTEGYYIDPISDQAILTCGGDGEWDQSLPICQEFRCSRPKEPQSGKIGSSADGKRFFNVGESISFSCEKGLRLKGKQRITCSQTYLGWNGLTPICTSDDNPKPTTEKGVHIIPGAASSPRSTSKITTTDYSTTTWKSSTVKPDETTKPTSGINIYTKANNRKTTTETDNLRSTSKTTTTTDYSVTRTSSTLKPDVISTPVRVSPGETTKPTSDRPTEESRCTRPKEPRNGWTVPLENDKEFFYFGESLSFYCTRGFRLEGKQKLTCSQTSVGWNHPAPICRPTSDDSHKSTTETIWSGTDFTTKTVTKKSSTLEPIRSTLETTKPTSGRPTDEFRCSRPEEPQNGWIGSTWDGKELFNVGEFIRFHCGVGFIREGKFKVTCSQTSRGWNYQTPICRPTSDDNYKGTTETDSSIAQTSTRRPTGKPRTEYTSWESTTDPTVKPRTEYPSWESTTDPTGTPRTEYPSWELTTGPTEEPGTENPIRKPYRRSTEKPETRTTTTKPSTTCDNPRGVQHAHFRQSEHEMAYTVGDVIHVVCDSGYRLKNPRDNKIKCLPNGQWGPHGPICLDSNQKTCSDPGSALYSSRFPDFRDFQNRFLPGETIQFVCDRGYTVDDIWDEVVVTCENTGIWDAVIPKCKKFFCEKPELPSHGRIVSGVNKESYEPGESVQFTCDEGYELRGPVNITCGPDYNSWSAWTPNCKVKICPMLEGPEDGRRIGSTNRIGDTVTFVCTDGFELRGSASRTCLPNKEWSGTLTICDRGDSHCPALGSPVGGSKFGSTYSQGKKVIFTCGSNFFMVGSESRTCLPNGMWSGTETICKYKYSFFDPVEVGPHIELVLDDLIPETCSSSWGFKLHNRDSCGDANRSGAIDLYFIFDVSGSIDYGQLTVYKRFAKAVVDKLGVSEYGTNFALIVFNTTVNSALDIKQSRLLTVNEVKRAIDGIQLRGGGTATADAFSHIKDSLDPETGRHDRPWAKNVAILLTDGKHNMGGDPAVITSSLKEPPYDMDIYCLGVGYDVDMSSLNAMASSEDKYWVLETAEHLANVTEYFSQVHDSSYETCGQGGLVNLTEAGTAPVSDIRQWPWVAMIYANTGGKVCSPETLEFLCGATLIDKQWLLTARRCVQRYEGNPDALHVTLGTTELHDSSLTFGVQNVLLSPTDGKDIALVKLRRPLILTPKFRPVCLPKQNPQGGFDRPAGSKWGSAVGFNGDKPCSICGGVSENRCESDRTLNQSIMLRSSDRTCQTIAFREGGQFYKRLSFCATGVLPFRHKGFPFMEQRDGQVFLTGILSWASGCDYRPTNYYTRVDANIDWIEENI